MNNPHDIDKMIADITINEDRFVKNIKDFNKIVSESAKRSEKYPAMRSLIIDCHLWTEELFDEIIEGHFVNYLCGREESFKEVLLSKITFEAKKEILMIILNIPDDTIRFIERLNSLRNAFAHGYDTKHDKYKYKGGKYIFEEDSWIDFIEKYVQVIKYFADCRNKIYKNTLLTMEGYAALRKLLDSQRKK